MEFISYSRAGAEPAPSAYSAGERDRIAWVDTAKGICIILVVMMHSTLGVGEEMGGEGFMHWLVAFAKPFRMPDFFLVSGLFLSRVIDRDWRTYADKRVVHFAYFYLLWLVIQSAFKYGQLAGGSPAGFLAHLAWALVEPYSTLWFIYILAIFSIVTKLLRPVPQAVVFVAAAVLQILPIETPWFLLNEFCERWVYFLAGYMLAERIFGVARTAGDRPALTLVFLALWASVNGFFALTPTAWLHAPSLAELPGIGLALGLAGAIAIIGIAALLAQARIDGPLRYCGRHSIAIYLAFFLPMAVTRTILVKTGIISDIGVAAALTTAAAVLLPLLLERMVRTTPLSFLFRRPALFHLRPVKGSQLQVAA